MASPTGSATDSGPHVQTTTATMRIWQSAIAALCTITYWAMVLFLPSSMGPLHGGFRWVLGVVSVGCLAGCIWVVWRAFHTQDGAKAQRFGLATALLVFFLVFLVATALTGGRLTLDLATRFGLGVGGTAVAGFAYAATQFDTIRAAASVPVVTLLVGIVVWPHAGTLVEPSVRQAIITWMGVILAATGVSEAAKQVGESLARSRVDGVDNRSQGDLGTPEVTSPSSGAAPDPGPQRVSSDGSGPSAARS